MISAWCIRPRALPISIINCSSCSFSKNIKEKPYLSPRVIPYWSKGLVPPSGISSESSESPRIDRTVCPSIHSIAMIPDSRSTILTSGTLTPFRTQRARALASDVILVRVSWAESDGCRYFLGKRYLRRTGREGGKVKKVL